MHNPILSVLPYDYECLTRSMIDKIKILILEYDNNDVELLKRQLNKSALIFIPEVVQTRETFENALNEFIPDIILSDYALPSFDGVTAFHIKLQKYPHIPFIIISGTIGEENAVELIKMGVTDYVLKDKIFSVIPKIVRALKETDEQIKKRIADEQIKVQNKKLLEIALLQSHQVRAPIANILGLINLFNFGNPGDPINTEVIRNLQKSTIDFDKIIHKIMQKTLEIKDILKI